MANTVNLRVTVNTNDTATITDLTDYANPARSGVGVFLKVYKVSYLSVKDARDLEPDSDDASLVTEWRFDLPKDGWHLIEYVAVPDYSSGTTYDQYDAVYDGNTNKVYRSKQPGNIGQSLVDTSYWEEIAEPATLAENKDTVTESANIDSLLYNKIILNKVTNYRGDKAIETAQEGASAVDEPTESWWHFSIADAQMEAALVAEIRQQFAAAERYVRRMDELVGI